MNKTILLGSMAVLLFSEANAQRKDSVLKGQTIEVIQSYKPQIKQAPKPQFSAELPPKDTTTPKFQYDVPQQVLPYSYTALPLRPLALGQDSTALPYPNYVKLGGGNLSTIYFDAGVGGWKGENYTTAIHLHHLQQAGLQKYQKTAFSGLEADGDLQTENVHYKGGIELLRNRYGLYGGFVDTGTEAPKHIYWGAAASLSGFNTISNAAEIDYHPQARISVYGREGVFENDFDLNVPLTKRFDENLSVSAGLVARIASINFVGKDNISSNVFQFTPKLSYEYEGFKGHLGVYPTIGKGEKTYILPDIYLQYKLPNALFSLFAGWNASLEQNTFRQLTTYNPYLSSNYLTQQTKQDEVFGGLRAGIGNNLSFSGKVSYREYQNLPMFLNNFGGDNSFFILYDNNVKAMSVEATLRYDIADIFTLKVGGSFYNYYYSTYARVWHEPALRLNADFSVRPVKGLTITAYSRVLDGIYAINQSNLEVKTKAAFDLGGSAEYQIVQRLSAFLNINNLLNNKYQRWYNYDAYGFNIFGGLRLNF
jgi:hypothetical protein